MDFVKDRWEISISWSIVKSLPIIQSGDDHKLWTEVRYRWAAEKYQPGGNVYYCLSGGTKTMPASYQQAAKLFGAKELFHVIVYSPPQTIQMCGDGMFNNLIKYMYVR